jgi:plasmid maintenance system antidote protein VapI
MNNSRMIGNNISLELKEKAWDVSTFAQKIGCSQEETYKLIEGRLFLPPALIKTIADALGITMEALMKDRGTLEYNSLIHNFRDFRNSANQELVLDLIDMYADLEEALI